MANNKQAESKVAGSKSVILTAVICGIILVGVIVWAAFTKSANDMKNLVAMTVGDKEISGAEFEYQYNESILTFQTEYSDYLSYMGVDFESDLGTQMYTEDQTWKDYFISNAVASLKERYLVLNDAEAAGYTLSEEDKEATYADIKSLKDALTSMGIDFDAYLQSIYTKDTTYDRLVDYSIINATAYNYIQDVVIPGFNIDDAKLNSYYDENKDDIDTVDFHYHLFTYTVPTDVEEGDESYKESAKAQADAALAAITDEASFASAVNAQLTDGSEATSTLSEDVAKANLLSDLATWLFDSSRVEGDKTVIEGNGGYFVLYYVGRDRGDYETVNVRHILIAPEEVEHVHDEDGNEDEEATAAAEADADAAAKAKAEEILNEWLAGDKTEDSFATLADANSDDTAAGGLYSQVTKGYMVEEFDAWIFDSARKAGDYEIVKTDYGYHIMYFVGTDEVAWKITAQNAIEDEEYAAYKADLEAKYEVVTYDEVMNLVD